MARPKMRQAAVPKKGNDAKKMGPKAWLIARVRRLNEGLSLSHTAQEKAKMKALLKQTKAELRSAKRAA